MKTCYWIYCSLIAAAAMLLTPALSSYGALLGASLLLGIIFAIAQVILIGCTALIDRSIQALSPVRHRRVGSRLPLPTQLHR